MKNRVMKTMMALTMTAALTVSMAAGAVSVMAADEKDPKDVKVALVLPGSANDKGWNQEAYDRSKIWDARQHIPRTYRLLIMKQSSVDTQIRDSMLYSDMEQNLKMQQKKLQRIIRTQFSVSQAPIFPRTRMYAPFRI